MNERAALRQTPMEPDRIGFFGKLPSHGDFVSDGLGRGLQEVLDIWMQAGLQRLQQDFPGDWEPRFRAMPTWRFIVERGQWGQATVAGVMLPSLDRVGRSFPLVIAAQITNFTSDPRSLCLDDSWFTAAEGIAESSARRDFDINLFIAALRRLRSPRPGDMETEGKVGGTAGSLWWRSDNNRRLVGFRTIGAPQPADILRLLDDDTPAAKQAAKPAQQPPPPPVATAPLSSARISPSAPSTAAKPHAPLKLAYSDVSHPGTRLSLNADNLLISAKQGIFAVADGMGESNSAVEAGKTAVAALGDVTAQETVDDTVQDIKGKLGRAHGLLQAARMSSDRDPPCASVAVLAVHQQSLALIWAGDVRCYIIRDGMMRCLTRDHLEIGLKRGLSRYLGRPGQFSPEIVVDNVSRRDRFLLCSNPLCRALPERSIAQILISADIDEAAAVLGQEALIAGCRDNFSAIVIDVSATRG
ncbi:type VI secretion system-associated protein TagF [Rhizobium deserti]|uniref:Type VI secretion system-associated protein TagF n=1 Tax=Rhizobium deserti TaxID=2547961 RepID=A0A4R5UP62_9HYPH|nr:type VI secretion system-associated protein TagF [Rhizobium deserti]TDK39701.1 type VI secretion system-associated protein TagF [Rhizobium deserti]